MTAATAAPTGAPSLLGLEVSDLTVAYGGNLALERESFAAPLGAITGLIGPNGAGKTTAFNACNGLLRPTGGRVHLFGADVTGRSTAGRARLGLGRTFQRVEVVNAMTVAANVGLGLEARHGGRSPVRQVRATRRSAQDIASATEEALHVCGIEPIATTRAANLSTGQRRLVELARVLAGGFRLLLLDEPSSGLDDEETDRFAGVLTSVVDDRGIGILLVEHDVPMVMRVCDRIHVLDFGRKIFEGTAAEAQASELVRAAYLGAADEGLA